MDTKNIKLQIPDYVFEVSKLLNDRGFKAFLVGGSVRDIIMFRKPKDYDVGTSANPEEILDIFPKAISTGAKFGSIIVLVQDKSGESHAVDVTTFRIEEKYINSRWPSVVKFTSDIEEDLSRRDFTMNAIAIDLSKIDKEGDILLDPFKGQKDIKNRLIRAVGVAKERFTEDALRALRACRFASVLGFELDGETKEAIKEVLTMIDNLSAERVRDEFLKILYDSPKPSVGLKLMKETGIMKIWIPELLEGVGVDQPIYHRYDVFEHTMRTVDIAEDSVKLAALFHDIAKPRTKKGKHFYGHDVKGAKMTKEIMERLRFSKKEIDRVERLVRWHMFYFPYDEEDYKKGKKKMRRRKHVGEWGDAAIRRFVRNVGGSESIDDLFKLRIADASSNPDNIFDNKEIELLQKRIGNVFKKDMALKVEDLDIDGNDLKNIGMKPGPGMGEILRDLLEVVIEDPVLNDKKKLLDIVKEKYLS